MENKQLGHKFARVRNHYGLTLAEFGKPFKIGKSWLSQIESGDKKPSDRLIDRLLAVYKVNPDWFYHDRGEMILPSQAPESSFLSDCDPEVVSLLALTKKVLKSGDFGAYAALKANILYFADTIEVRDKNLALETRVSLLEAKVKNLIPDPHPDPGSSEKTGT